jgi:hypothetical protein
MPLGGTGAADAAVASKKARALDIEHLLKFGQ